MASKCEYRFGELGRRRDMGLPRPCQLQPPVSLGNFQGLTTSHQKPGTRRNWQTKLVCFRMRLCPWAQPQCTGGRVIPHIGMDPGEILPRTAWCSSHQAPRGAAVARWPEVSGSPAFANLCSCFQFGECYGPCLQRPHRDGRWGSPTCLNTMAQF